MTVAVGARARARSTPRARPRPHNGRVTVRREVAVSAALSAVAIVGIGLGGLWAARAAATSEAIHQAELATEVLARAVIEPALDDDLRTGDPDAVEELDEAVRIGVLGSQVLTVRVWAEDGTVLYSDDLAGIGSRFPLGAEEREVLATGQSHAELSALEKPENADQADFEELLEVYVRITDDDGTPMLFETYQSTGGIAGATARIVGAFLPVVLGGLLLLGLVQALLSWRLARRLERTQREREGLLQQALDASELERRTIAADLHDGVVQDLVGITFALDGLAAAPGADPAIATAASGARGAVRSLRSLLVDIYPPNLAEVGLAAAVDDLAASLRATGIAVEVAIDPDIRLGQEQRAAAYRTVREALSNVRRHSGARRVTVSLSRASGDPGGPAVLEVADDGVGFDPTRVPADHVGLRLLRDRAASVGARLSVTAAPGSGTRIRMELPA